MERRAGLRVGNDAAGIELHGASGEGGNFGFTVEAHDYGAARAVHLAQRFGEPGNAERIEAGGGFIEEQD